VGHRMHNLPLQPAWINGGSMAYSTTVIWVAILTCVLSRIPAIALGFATVSAIQQQHFTGANLAKLISICQPQLSPTTSTAPAT
jgi:hypothetical protein